MKNIHIIPTDKPSRLRIGNNGNFVLGLMQSAIISKNDSYTNQNIYITSDEEIKEGDWVICSMSNTPTKALQNEDYSRKNAWRKIILTTDPSLAPDVQKIDDEFLEWFCKNPSCESVEYNKNYNRGNGKYYYKIIIPKEEPKPDYSKIKEGLKKSIKGKEHFIQHFKNGGSVEDFKPFEEPNQETLEEFIIREGYPIGSQQEIWEDGVRNGAKWQQNKIDIYNARMEKERVENREFLKLHTERSYSEEEVELLLETLSKVVVYQGNDYRLPHYFEYEIKEVIKQFKKK